MNLDRVYGTEVQQILFDQSVFAGPQSFRVDVVSGEHVAV